MNEEAKTSLQPLADLEPLSNEARDDYYATIGELMATDQISESDAADLMFGPDPLWWRM